MKLHGLVGWIGASAALREPRRPERLQRMLARGLLLVLLLGYGALLWRLYVIQVVEHARWHRLAVRQQLRLRVEPAERGRLLVRDGQREAVAAVSLDRAGLLIEGRKGRDIEAFLTRLERALPDLTDAEREELRARLAGERGFWFRRRRIPADRIEPLRRARLPHVQLEVEPVRSHPWGAFAGQVLGMVSAEGKGQSGLERTLDHALQGQPGKREVRLDNLRRELVVPGGLNVPALPGRDVLLTLERGIQAAAEAELAATAAEWTPQGAAAVVVDIHTGDVLAMASWPPFDPEAPKPGRADDPRVLRARRQLAPGQTPPAPPPEGIANLVIGDTYEPGSTIKPLLISVAWELGLGHPTRPIHCPPVLKVPGRRRPISDVHTVGSVLESDVIVQSSNTGSYLIASRMSPEQIRRALEGFGLGRATGLGLPGEARGDLRSLSRLDPTTLGSVAQGYAVTVTPLQMALAYAALGNGGILPRPRLVLEVRGREGGDRERRDAVPAGRPLSGRMLEPLKRSLTGVVNDEHGTARRAASKAYTVAGKTGTTKLLVNGQYDEREIVGSFCGFAPAEAPRISFAVVVWGPTTRKGKVWGGTVAAPCASRIAEQALRALGVAPRPVEAKTLPAGQRR